MTPAAVILAAGGSARLGRPKQLVQFNGQSLVRRAAATAVDFGCRPVVVVLGRDAAECENELVGLGVRSMVNSDWQTGMGSSLKAGFDALPAGTSGAFMLLCDQPFVTVGTLARLSSGNAPVNVASYADTIGPPLFLRGEAIDRLRDWPATDGAKGLWLGLSEGPRRVACPEAESDVDTAADVAALSRSAADAT